MLSQVDIGHRSHLISLTETKFLEARCCTLFILPVVLVMQEALKKYFTNPVNVMDSNLLQVREQKFKMFLSLSLHSIYSAVLTIALFNLGVRNTDERVVGPTSTLLHLNSQPSGCKGSGPEGCLVHSQTQATQPSHGGRPHDTTSLLLLPSCSLDTSSTEAILKKTAGKKT